MDIVMLLLRLLHVGAGALWVGAVVFTAVFLNPAVATLGADGPRVMQALQRRRLIPAMMTLAVVTLLSGLVLYWRVTVALAPAWVFSGFGLTLLVGALASIAAFLIGITISRPAAARMAALGAAVAASGAPPTPEHASEFARLQGRLRFGMRSVATLLVIALAAMAIARYV